MNKRVEKWGALLPVLVSLSCATGQSATRLAAQQPVATPGAIVAAPQEKDAAAIPIEIRPAEADSSRAHLLGLLKLGPPENERTLPIREALEGTLNVTERVPGVTPQPIRCSRRLCVADVYYSTAADFRDFDNQTVRNPTSQFNSWEGPNGHTGLLKAKNKRLLATWYFVAPDSGMPTETRAHLIREADRALREARENSKKPAGPPPGRHPASGTESGPKPKEKE